VAQITLGDHDAAVARGGRTVWSDGSFEIPTGAIAAVIGPNGSGKTTLLELLLERPLGYGVVPAYFSQQGTELDERGSVLLIGFGRFGRGGHFEGFAALDTLVEREIQELYPPISARTLLRVRTGARQAGVVVFFTGLSGSGKSTIAKAFAADMEASGRTVTLLDGDEVRHHLSRGLGFDAESRAINIDRIAYVASLVAHHGGLAVAAPIAPFDAGRKAARAMAEAVGYESTGVEVDPVYAAMARDAIPRLAGLVG